MKNKSLQKPTPLCLIFYCFAFACGGFHVYLSAACAVALCVLLAIRLIKRKSVYVTLHPVNVALFAIPLLYLLSAIWAVDRGEALMGFVKFLPLSLFMLAVSDKEEDRNSILTFLPAAGAFQTAVGSILMQIPVLRSYFSVSGRLSGFFQYSNTFALFLLLGILVLLTQEQIKWHGYVILSVLVFGILYSGSRTTAVLTVIFAAAAILTGKNKKVKLTALICIAGLAAAAGIYAVVSGNYSAIGRFLSISLKESTFLGRLLYWKDGLRLSVTHPFGLGYLGWNFAQYRNQTGVYTVQFVHNEYLQLLLDVGIPGIGVFGYCIARVLFSKNTDRKKRLLLLAFCGHMFMDFDLQFTSMFLLLAVLLYTQSEKHRVTLRRNAVLIPSVVCVLLALIPGVSHGLFHFKQYRAAAWIYPFNTSAQVALLGETGTSKSGVLLADRLLKRNPYLAPAYGVKAAAAFSDGDIEQMAFFKTKQIENAPYHMETYDEYCDMLAVGFGLYKKQNDVAGMRFCREKMLAIPEMLTELKDKTDPLAFQIDDKPSFELNPASIAWINQIREVKLP